MENKKYLQDINEIRDMMHRSSRFISLSGLAGVFAGCYAIIGAVMAQMLLNQNNQSLLNNLNSDMVIVLFFIAIAVLILAFGTAIILTRRKAKANRQKIWDASSKRLMINFFTPLLAGGIFCLVLLQYALIGLIAPAMMIFYGLGLISASKYSFSDLRSLGYANVILGLISTQFPEFGLYFWALGFGIFHIIYGIWMYNKYDRKNA